MSPTRTAALTLRKTSEIAVPPEEVWARVITPQGINDEMGPYLAMTMPRTFRGRTIADVTPGTHIGKSLLLLFGFIPVGYDDITIARIEPGRMFREESVMTGMQMWVHQRTLQTRGDITVVTDEITLAPKAPLRLIPGSATLIRAVVSAFFSHRHRRLRRSMALLQ
ncbi:MAG: hypothetical protein KDB71_11560 [Mycobacterium sp.]|nr:hypothetical protein [Mycobacterium sp.]